MCTIVLCDGVERDPVRPIVRRPVTVIRRRGERRVAYDLLDSFLLRIVDRGEPLESVAAELDVDPSLVEEITERYRASAHKRTSPPRPGIDDRTP